MNTLISSGASLLIRTWDLREMRNKYLTEVTEEDQDEKDENRQTKRRKIENSNSSKLPNSNKDKDLIPCIRSWRVMNNDNHYIYHRIVYFIILNALLLGT
jgi:hypothetical protein